MPTVTTLSRGPVTVSLYDCDGEPGLRPAAELHENWSASYVRRGSFGCACRGRRFELVAGGVLLGRPGDEYICTHDHHAGGDQCVAVFLEPALADEIAGGAAAWTSSALPPLAELAVIGEQLHVPNVDHTEIRLQEVALRFVASVTGIVDRHRTHRLRPSPVDRKRAVESALWIEAHCADRLDLASLAARCGLGSFHYLRLFASVIGVTPHQFLLRSRLRAAARLLAGTDSPITDVALDCGFADLSNFTRTFGKAAGISPRQYRAAAVAGRNRSKIFQVS